MFAMSRELRHFPTASAHVCFSQNLCTCMCTFVSCIKVSRGTSRLPRGYPTSRAPRKGGERKRHAHKRRRETTYITYPQLANSTRPSGHGLGTRYTQTYGTRAEVWKTWQDRVYEQRVWWWVVIYILTSVGGFAKPLSRLITRDFSWRKLWFIIADESKWLFHQWRCIAGLPGLSHTSGTTVSSQSGKYAITNPTWAPLIPRTPNRGVTW